MGWKRFDVRFWPIADMLDPQLGHFQYPGLTHYDALF
jgi:hypothetical protein